MSVASLRPLGAEVLQMLRWGVDGGCVSADDGVVSEVPTSSSRNTESDAALGALPEPRHVTSGSTSSNAGRDGWTEYKPHEPMKAGTQTSTVTINAIAEADTTKTTKPKRSALWYALTHLNDTHERRRLLHYMKRKRALLASGALVFIGAVTFLIAIGFIMARSAPGWWVDVDASSPNNIRLAELVQNGALSHLFEDRNVLIGGQVEWPVKMTDEAANAWLNIKLPEWFSKISDGMVWPETVTQVQIIFDNGTVHIGVRVLTESGSRIYSCAITPELRDDGSLWMKARTVSMGKLTLPANWVLRGAESRVSSYIPEQLRGTAEAEALFEKLTGTLPLFDIAEVSLGDGRIVRLLDLRVRDGSIIAQCVTRNPE